MTSNIFCRAALRPLKGHLVLWKEPRLQLITSTIFVSKISFSRADSLRNQQRPQTTLTPRTIPDTYPPYIPPNRGILARLPPSFVPYAQLSRIEKPGGLYGFYMAYLIGLGYGACLVTPAVSPASLAGTAGVLLVYNVFLRGAACTANDVLDREYDRQVARCRNRPVARGAVTPTQGYVWYGAQTMIAGAVIVGLPNPALALTYAGE